MRLHHLHIEAFGPFGGTVEVDFDELNTAGQFLISGATGSGKTSILDAVCFALYGEVPGERQRAKHLRSDHARPEAEPRVTLTLTIAERLIRISRSPAWERPKRRGTGLTQQQASVRLEQRVDGEWQCLATRLDEAGHLVNTWLGMTPVQFTQVALLPQGGFQTFLQSPTTARQAVLQRLFRTDRFERVERWFGEFRRTLNRARMEALQGIDLVATRLAEAAGAPEPPPGEDRVETYPSWAEEHVATTADAHTRARAAREAAATENHAATADLERASALAVTLDRAQYAQQQLDDLEASAADFALEVQRLREHENARSLAPLINATAEAKQAAEVAERRAAVRLREAGVENAALDECVARAGDEVQRADRAVALAAKLTVVESQLAKAKETQESSAASLQELRAAAAAIPVRQQALALELRRAVQAQAELSGCALELEGASRRLAAADELEHARFELAEKTDLRRSEQDRVQELRQAYQDAREARIEAMASELAVGLVVGCSCPVCGSTAHPSPASSRGAGGRKLEERARRRYESAGVELTALDEVIAGARARVEALLGTVEGVERDTLARQVEALRARHTEVGARAEKAVSLSAEAEALEEQLRVATNDVGELVDLSARARAEADALSAQVGSLRAELDAALGDHLDAAGYAQHARGRAKALQAAVEAVRTRDEATVAWAHQRTSLDLQARSLGFESGVEAEASSLDEAVAVDIAERQEERAQVRAAAASLLADPEVVASLGSPRPDIAEVSARATRTSAALSKAEAEVQVTRRRAQRTSTIAGELSAALAAYAPLAAKAQSVSALSALLEGTSADNRLRMRLSAFVLAERLRQVVDAANARLAVISEGRYLLSYQEERGAGDNRGGLSLSVLDEWTGIRRDPTTLSGGETFVVSLCLALGLADTVADESGGLRIDTLFIDEGFGSLDAQTLDSVIDILGQLSQGGRVTGVVSHVPELRERMPAVLEVVPSKTGSTVRRASV